MAVRVLVVDDSRFFRRRVTEILNADSQLDVIGVAENGMEAVDMVAKLKPDVVTMDIEMPVMDGITAVKRIMARNPTPILMFSSLTTDGAQATLDALDAGAVDFLPKRFEDISRDRDEAKRQLCARVRQVGSSGKSKPRPRPAPAAARPASASSAVPRPYSRRPSTTATATAPATASAATAAASPAPRPAPQANRVAVNHGFLKQFQILTIGTSTGGPVALQDILSKLPADFPLPILMVQHMPATFTQAFSNRLNKICNVTVKEAEDGDALVPGTALLAPGGMQTVVELRQGKAIARVKEAKLEQTYKPCVDITFESVAKLYPGKILALILTGMGSDGREGVRLMKKDNATVWIQDEASCVVYGMPGAVAEAGLADSIMPLSEIGNALVQGV
jgi:two-component system chemotaxis response regulator CheB